MSASCSEPSQGRPARPRRCSVGPDGGSPGPPAHRRRGAPDTVPRPPRRAQHASSARSGSVGGRSRRGRCGRWVRAPAGASRARTSSGSWPGGGWALGHERASAGIAPYEALFCQLCHGVSRGHATDAELRAKVGVRWQPLSWPQRGDALAQPVSISRYRARTRARHEPMREPPPAGPPGPPGPTSGHEPPPAPAVRSARERRADRAPAQVPSSACTTSMPFHRRGDERPSHSALMGSMMRSPAVGPAAAEDDRSGVRTVMALAMPMPR